MPSTTVGHRARALLATLINAAGSGVGDELLRQAGLPVGGMISAKLPALV